MSTNVDGNEELIESLYEEELEALQEGDIPGALGAEEALEDLLGVEHDPLPEPELVVDQLMEEASVALASGDLAALEEAEALAEIIREDEEDD